MQNLSNERHGIKELLIGWKDNTIKTALELNESGFYSQLLNKYSKSGWLDNPAYGIYTKAGSKVSWPAAISALQKQYFPVHVGALSALKLHGIIQYLTLDESKEQLFILNTSNKKKELPKWFSVIVSRYQYHQLHLFKNNNYGLVQQNVDKIATTISSPERAALEMLAVVPKYVSYSHAYELIEGAVLLRPEVMQKLLENCTSIKVKRLFLYLADKHNLPLLEHLDQNKINLGTGDRLIAGGGTYSSKYKISVPKMAVAEDEEGIGRV
jgi:hypothetical protein